MEGGLGTRLYLLRCHIPMRLYPVVIGEEVCSGLSPVAWQRLTEERGDLPLRPHTEGPLLLVGGALLRVGVSILRRIEPAVLRGRGGKKGDDGHCLQFQNITCIYHQCHLVLEDVRKV